MRKSLRSLLGIESEQNSIQSSPSQQISCNKFSKIGSREKRKNDSYKYARERLMEHYKRLIKQTDLHQLPIISYGKPQKASENVIEIQRHPRWDKQSQSQDMLDSRYTDQACSRIDFTKKEEDDQDCKFSKYPTIIDDPEQQQKKSVKRSWQEVCANKQSPKISFHTQPAETRIQEPVQQKNELVRIESVEKLAPEPIQKAPEPVQRAPEPVQKAPEPTSKAQEPITSDPIAKPPEPIPKTASETTTKPAEPIAKPVETAVEPAVEKTQINPFTQTVSNPLFSAPWLISQPVQQVIPTQQSFNLFQQEPIPQQQMQVQQQFPIQESVFPFQQQNAFNQQPFPQQFNNENLFPQQNLYNSQQQPQQNLFPQQQSLFPNQQTNFQDPFNQQQPNLFGQQQQNLFAQPQQQNLFPQQQQNLFPQTQQQNLFPQQQQNLFPQQQQQNLFPQQQQNLFPQQQQQNLFPQQQQQPNPFGSQASSLFQFQTTQLGGGSFSADDHKQHMQAAGLFQAGADLFQQQDPKNTQSQISADRYKNKMRNNNQQRLG